MIEPTPKIKDTPFQKLSEILMNPEYRANLEEIEKEYLYWDKAKFYKPQNINDHDYWAAIKFSRIGESVSFHNKVFKFRITKYMQKYLHDFDMYSGGTLPSADIISQKKRQYYLLSSLMEEAIASSQMEGANTTRKIAKDMLRKKSKPCNKDQQMIVNNYNTIRFLSENKDRSLSPEFLSEIHKKISEHTLENPLDEGNFRNDDNIVVMDALQGEIAHTPPIHTEIKQYITDLCNFANNDDQYIHPVVKAIIIHFMISYLHPFTDGNGRTARSLFYWYMLKKGYWFTEFLSISRIIYKSKRQYERSFLYVENDDMDLGYFINYNIKIIDKSLNDLKEYLNRKTLEEESLLKFKIIDDINERQAGILKIASERPSTIFIAKELETIFSVSVKTIRNDLKKLTEAGFLDIVPLNLRLQGYVRSKHFEEKIKFLKEN